MLAYDTYKIGSVRHKDENGFLHVDVSNITKEAVNPYYGKEIPGFEDLHLKPDKIYYGYRPFDELEKAAGTFNNLPLLSRHVEDGADKKNQHLRVGSLGTDAEAVKPYLTNSLVIYDQNAIDGIESEDKKELSCAYRYDPVFEPGFFNGQKYDFRMKNIRGNHVALVHEGRAGSDVVVADSNSIKYGEKMSTKLKKWVSQFSSRKGFAMDEDLEEAIKEIVDEKVDEKIEEIRDVEPQVEVKEKITEDAEKIDKRKLIDEIGGILKGKVDEELWRTIIKKVEEASYNDSERSADDEDLSEDKCARDADPVQGKSFAEGVKYGERLERNPEERKKLDREHESKGMKGAMDAASIELKIRTQFKALNEAAQEVRPLIGSVDPMAFDSANDIYEKALKLNGYDTTKYSPNAYRGMVDVLKQAKNEKVQMSFDSASTNSLLKEFPELKKVKVGDL